MPPLYTGTPPGIDRFLNDLHQRGDTIRGTMERKVGFAC
jgi:hypothetical protein